MSARITSPAAIDAWMHMLDQILESIARALHEVDDQERMLNASDVVGADLTGLAGRCLDQFDERLRSLQSHLDAADDAAAQADELLAEDEHAARAWLTTAAVRRRELAGLGVGGLS